MSPDAECKSAAAAATKASFYHNVLEGQLGPDSKCIKYSISASTSASHYTASTAFLLNLRVWKGAESTPFAVSLLPSEVSFAEKVLKKFPLCKETEVIETLTRQGLRELKVEQRRSQNNQPYVVLIQLLCDVDPKTNQRRTRSLALYPQDIARVAFIAGSIQKLMDAQTAATEEKIRNYGLLLYSAIVNRMPLLVEDAFKDEMVELMRRGTFWTRYKVPITMAHKVLDSLRRQMEQAQPDALTADAQTTGLDFLAESLLSIQ